MTPLQVKLAALGVVLLLAVAALAYLWQPKRQIYLHTVHLLFAADHRRFGRLDAFIDPAYTDAWGFGKATLTRNLHEVLSQFFALSVRPDWVICTHDGTTGSARFHLRIEGRGTAIAEEAQRRVDEIEAPFVLTWRHASWKPWDWTLLRVENSELHVEPHETFDSIF